ncbi:hypothetical protein RDABS01_003554 [Bienertia sinuspersici]
MFFMLSFPFSIEE